MALWVVIFTENLDLREEGAGVEGGFRDLCLSAL